MEKDDPIRDIWIKGKLDPPSVTLALNKETNQSYIVIEDDSTIIRLMNSRGHIYVVAKFRCEILTDSNGTVYYYCSEPIHPITCSKIEGNRDRYVLDNIKDEVFR